MRKQPYTPKIKDFTQTYFDNKLPARLDQEKREEFILTYTPLIKYIASRLAMRLPTYISIDDLISSGVIGLIDAVDKFDTTKNVQFKTYAEFRIKGAMLDELRALDWVPRSVRRKIHELEHMYSQLEKELGRPAMDEEVALALDVSMEEFHKLLDETKSVTFLDIELLRQRVSDAGDGGEPTDFFEQAGKDPFGAINLSQVRELVAKAIEGLSQKERLVVTLYYYEELTMKEIGLVMGYTESRISQMHSKAVLRLRSKIKKMDPLLAENCSETNSRKHT